MVRREQRMPSTNSPSGGSRSHAEARRGTARSAKPVAGQFNVRENRPVTRAGNSNRNRSPLLHAAGRRDSCRVHRQGPRWDASSPCIL